MDELNLSPTDFLELYQAIFAAPGSSLETFDYWQRIQECCAKARGEQS